MKPTETLIQAIAVAAELTGTELSKPAARVMATDLARYPETQVLGALTRCRKELRGRMTIADVVSRLDDGRPGAEEAWAMIPRDDQATVVWTSEMVEAWAAARPLLAEGEAIPARMAFLERYRAVVAQARDAGQPVQWIPSLGWDPADREGALLEAAERGRLTVAHVAALLPSMESPRAQALLVNGTPRLPGISR